MEGQSLQSRGAEENVLKVVSGDQGPPITYHRALSRNHCTFGSGYGATDVCTVPPTDTEKEVLGDAKMGFCSLRDTSSSSSPKEVAAHWPLPLSPAGTNLL